MTLNQFRIRLKDVNGFNLADDVFFFKKPCCIVDTKNDTITEFKSIDKALEHVVNGEKVADIILKMSYLPIVSLDGKINWDSVFTDNVGA